MSSSYDRVKVNRDSVSPRIGPFYVISIYSTYIITHTYYIYIYIIIISLQSWPVSQCISRTHYIHPYLLESLQRALYRSMVLSHHWRAGLWYAHPGSTVLLSLLIAWNGSGLFWSQVCRVPMMSSNYTNIAGLAIYHRLYLFLFPTCQVRVVRFYVSCLLLLSSPLLLISSPPPPRRPPRPPRTTATRDPQCSLSDLNHDHPCSVFPAGPQPRPSMLSVPCRTSTTTIPAQCSLPDLNHDHPRPVFPAGPQPRPSTPSVPCRTSTASIHAKCSLPDLM